MSTEFDSGKISCIRGKKNSSCKTPSKQTYYTFRSFRHHGKTITEKKKQNRFRTNEIEIPTYVNTDDFSHFDNLEI
jgi:hypothetical protein